MQKSIIGQVILTTKQGLGLSPRVYQIIKQQIKQDIKEKPNKLEITQVKQAYINPKHTKSSKIPRN